MCFHASTWGSEPPDALLVMGRLDKDRIRESRCTSSGNVDRRRVAEVRDWAQLWWFQAHVPESCVAMDQLPGVVLMLIPESVLLFWHVHVM